MLLTDNCETKMSRSKFAESKLSANKIHEKSTVYEHGDPSTKIADR